ncbi:major capsid protein [Xanthobacter flavus]|uniref:major capsid protein n=1 Tax=Xanthobacter flavus TaxID=281 RepID=UPI00372B9A88
MAGALITLPEYAKGLEKDDATRPIVEMFAQESDIFRALQWEGLNGPVYEGYKEAVLPTASFRAINAAAGSSDGTIEPFQEATYVIDEFLDVDRAIVDRAGPTRRDQKNAMKTKGIIRMVTDSLFKGDNGTNPKEPNGLQKRADLYSRVMVNNAGSGGGPLSLAKLDAAIAETANPTHLVMPYGMKKYFPAMVRSTSIAGYVVRSTMNELGKVEYMYGDLPILFGYPIDKGARLLPFTEAAYGGGTAACSSVYVLSLNPENGGLKGIQLKPMGVQDVGLVLTGDTPLYRTWFTWDLGFVIENEYSFMRLSSITDAAIVA